MGTSEVSNRQQPPWSADPINRGEGDAEMKPATPLTLNKPDGKRHNDSEIGSRMDDGIFIPAVLQPLFGFDFVPYIPHDDDKVEKSDSATPEKMTTAKSSHHQKISDETLQDLDLLAVSSSSSDRLVIEGDVDSLEGPNSTSSPAASSKNNESGANLNASAATFDAADNDDDKRQERATMIVNTPKNRRERRGIKTRLSSFVKGKKGRRRANSSPMSKNGSSTPRAAVIRTMSSDSLSVSWHDSLDGDAAAAAAPTPTANAGSNAGSSPRHKIEFTSSTTAATKDDSLGWIQKQRKEVQDHVTHLNTVQQEAKRMQSRTTQINKRINVVQNEMSQLQRALKKAEERLQRELTDFETAKSDLERLEVSAIQASEAVIESIRRMKSVEVDQPGSNVAVEETPSTPIIGNNVDIGIDVALAPPSSEVPTTNNSNNEQNLLVLPQQYGGAITPLRPRAATAPDTLTTTRSESFMRAHDLDLDRSSNGVEPKDENSTLSSSTSSFPNPTATDFVYVDHNITTIIHNLSKLGYAVATDESDRFKPTPDTKKLLAKYESISFNDDPSLGDWPIQPWHAAYGEDILIWIGGVSHSGFGCNWPVCKGRALMKISAKGLLDYLLDSSRIKEYNKMSLGRDDVYVIQNDIATKEVDSTFGFKGSCKIVRAVNKPRLLPKSIEMMSLMYAKSLDDENDASAPGSYMIVNRSVFDDDSGEHKSKSKNTIRSEMLLGVTLIRSVSEDTCELTSINHVYMPGVPEFAAKRAAPSQASGMLRDLQNIFNKK